MNDEIWTAEEFANKIDWEGGIFGALEYGLRSEMLEDGELKDLWRQLEELYAEQIEPLVSKINDLLY